jgi:hypothetical protein
MIAIAADEAHGMAAVRGRAALDYGMGGRRGEQEQ